MESRRPVRLVQSEVWLGRAEFETMIGPRVPDPAETATERSAGPRSIEVRPLLGSPRASTVAPLFSPAATVEDDVTVDAKDDALIRLDGLDGHEPTPPASPKWASRVKSHRLRWAAAGAFGLIFVGGAGLVPLLASPSGSPYVTAGKTAPASPPVAVPAPDPASNRLSEPVDFARPVPPAAPKPPAEVTVRSESPAAAPSHTIRSNNHTITQSEHAASTAPAPARQEALDEAYRWWSQADEYGPKVPRWTHYGPEPTPWP
jgi:hypothetical protein